MYLQREKPKSLKFKVGDKVMGFHRFGGNQVLVGGAVIKAKATTDHISDNSYSVKMLEEIPQPEEYKREIWNIEEYQLAKLDNKIWGYVLFNWINYLRLNERAMKHRELMLWLLSERGARV